MSFLSFSAQKDRYGIIIDIGSGSVLAAIVHSQAHTQHPTIVWAHRDHVALKNIDSIEQCVKAVMSALMSACMKLDGEGRQVLSDYAPGAKLTYTQASISAPWSYTVTKKIDLTHQEPFEITNHFLEEMVDSAQAQVEEELNMQLSAINSNLTVITRTTMDLLCNGYRVSHPTGQKTKHISLTQAIVVAQSYVTEGLAEVQQKLFPAAPLQSLSFILMLYCMIRSLYPNTDDVCLVDITDEASELGVIRDGSLTYSTHTPFGLFSLAREMAEVSKVPLHEALSYLRAPDLAGVKTRLPAETHDEISFIFKAYTERLSSLLNETGDSLSIPKKVFLHVEDRYGDLFNSLLAEAAKSATKIDHTVTSIASDVLPSQHYREQKSRIGDYITDTALLLHAEFFHKQTNCLDFKYS
jgi:hypothetical protein